MRIFSRLFDSPDVRAAKEIIKDTKRQFAPIFNVSEGIAEAVGACSGAVRAQMNFPTEEKNGEHFFYVVYVNLYIFLCIYQLEWPLVY